MSRGSSSRSLSLSLRRFFDCGWGGGVVVICRGTLPTPHPAALVARVRRRSRPPGSAPPQRPRKPPPLPHPRHETGALRAAVHGGGGEPRDTRRKRMQDCADRAHVRTQRTRAVSTILPTLPRPSAHRRPSCLVVRSSAIARRGAERLISRWGGGAVVVRRGVEEERSPEGESDDERERPEPQDAAAGASPPHHYRSPAPHHQAKKEEDPASAGPFLFSRARD